MVKDSIIHFYSGDRREHSKSTNKFKEKVTEDKACVVGTVKLLLLLQRHERDPLSLFPYKVPREILRKMFASKSSFADVK